MKKPKILPLPPRATGDYGTVNVTKSSAYYMTEASMTFSPLRLHHITLKPGFDTACAWFTEPALDPGEWTGTEQ